MGKAGSGDSFTDNLFTRILSTVAWPNLDVQSTRTFRLVEQLQPRNNCHVEVAQEF